jgi:hypothetical protein
MTTKPKTIHDCPHYRVTYTLVAAKGTRTTETLTLSSPHTAARTREILMEVHPDWEDIALVSIPTPDLREKGENTGET